MDVSIWYLDLDTLSWFFHFQRVRDIFFEVVSKCQKRQQQEFVWYMYFVHRLLRRWFGWSGWNGWFRVCRKKHTLLLVGDIWKQVYHNFFYFFREATFWKAPRLRGHRAFGVLLAQMVWGKLFFVIFFFQWSIRLARPGWSVGNKGLIDNYYGYHVRKTKRNLGGPKGFG